MAKLFQQILKAGAVDQVNQKKRAKMGDHHESTAKIFLNLLKKKTPQFFGSPSVQGVNIINCLKILKNVKYGYFGDTKEKMREENKSAITLI